MQKLTELLILKGDFMSKKSKKSKSTKSRQPGFIKKSKPRIPDPVKSSMTRSQVEKDLEESLKELEVFKAKVRNDNTRQILKIMCLSLNEKYGFGRKRNATLVTWMFDLINEEINKLDGDAGDFWYKVDQRLSQLRMDFFPTEDEIKRSENR